MNDLGNKEVMAKNIQHYMDLNKKTRNDLCDALGIKYTTLRDWLKAKTYPRIDKIERMANYFGVAKSDLVESRDKTIANIRQDFANSKLADNISKLTPENQEKISAAVEVLLLSQEES